MECLIRELWGSILCGWNYVSCIIHNDTLFGNLISLANLVVICWGLKYTYGKMKSELLERKKNIATGFYTHLRVFIKRLGTLTTDGDSFSSLSSNNTIRDKENKEVGDMLKNLSHEFLCYLSTSPQQAPLNDWEEWQKNMSGLIEYLIDFGLIHTGTRFPSLSNEVKIESYRKILKDILDSMDTAIETEMSKYFSSRKKRKLSEWFRIKTNKESH